MEIYYKILNEFNLKIHKFKGDFSYEQYYVYMRDIISKKEWKNIKNVITDLRECNLEPAFDDLEKLVSFRDLIIKSKYCNIFIVDNPSSTVITHLYQEDLTEKEYDYKYCTTVEYAIELLALTDKREEIEHTLNNIENYKW